MVTADAARLAREVIAAPPALAAALAGPWADREEGLVELGVAIALVADRGFDRALWQLGQRVDGAAALLVLSGYWRAAAVVDATVYAALVSALADRAWWTDGAGRGPAGLAAVASLTVYPDRGVAAATAQADRLALALAMADQPAVAGLAARLQGRDASRITSG